MPAVIVALVLVWLFKRSTLAKWSWNPLSWWNSATGAAGTIVSDVKNWVLGIVGDAVNLVENDVVWVYQWAWSAIQDVQIAAYWASQWATAAISNLTSWAGREISAAEGLAKQWVSDLGNWTQWALGGVAALARQLVGDLGSWANWAINGVAGLARQLVADLGNWAATAIAALEGLAKQWVTDLGRWAADAMKALWADLYSTIYRDFIKPLEDVAHWVTLAWDWIVWFAEHPFTLLHDAERDVIGWTRHLADDLENVALAHQFNDSLDALGAWLGG